MELKQRIREIAIGILKAVGLFGCLFFLVLSLDLMSSAFTLISGRYTTNAFSSSSIINNQLAGLVIGIAITVVLQSSSTSTSIVVSMVASKILTVKQAIPIIMGANIGTSVTSTLVSFGHLGDRGDFRRAFSGAIVHDIFNFLTVFVLLPIEIASGYLEKVTKLIVDSIIQNHIEAKEVELLNAITKPLTNLIIQVNKTALENALDSNGTDDTFSLLKKTCGVITYKNKTMNDLNQIVTVETTENIDCKYLFRYANIPEWSIGLIVLIIALILLCGSLVIMVKILNSILKGPISKLLQKFINSDFPGVFKYLTGYVAVVIGCALTMLIQSSSAFTSSLVPLVGTGLVTLERVFPLALGSNVGTTITGILAAFSASSKTLRYALQIAFCHSLFNITGIVIWYPLPFMRKVPLNIAKSLSKIVEKYRWFAIFYVILLFILLPAFIFVLSLAGWIALGCVLGVILVVIVFILVVNLLQRKKPKFLPKILRTWAFLPRPLRSLEPYDNLIIKCCRYFKCCKYCKCCKAEALESQPQITE